MKRRGQEKGKGDKEGRREKNVFQERLFVARMFSKVGITLSPPPTYCS